MSEQTITAYAVRNLLNQRIAEAGYTKIIPGPQVYTYAKNGLIDGIKRETMTGVMIDQETAAEWIERYITNNSKKWESKVTVSLGVFTEKH